MHKIDAEEDCVLVDDRVVRANATLTTVVLACSLVSPRSVSVLLLLFQSLMFAIGIYAPKMSLYTKVSRALNLHRLYPLGHGEHPKPVRFSQMVGLAFTAPALVSLLLGSQVGLWLTGLCLGASALNAFAGICLACRVYPRLNILRHNLSHLFIRE